MPTIDAGIDSLSIGAGAGIGSATNRSTALRLLGHKTYGPNLNTEKSLEQVGHYMCKMRMANGY